MKSRLLVLVPSAFVVACIAILAFGTFPARSGGPTPLHVTAVFFDGVDSADYRQACSVWQTKAVWKCEAGLTVQLGEAALMGEFGGYAIVPHSERMWRTGRIEYATVQVVYVPTRGAKLTAHLRKRPGGEWLIEYVA